MRGIDRISERILEEARAEANRIVEEAQEKARSLKAERAEREKKNSEVIEKKNIEEADERKRRMLASAGMEMRKEILFHKQEMIDLVMEKAKQEILDMPRDEYRQIIYRMLLDTAQGDEEVYFSSADEERLDQSLIDQVNAELSGMGRKGALKLSPDRGDFEGGFILKAGGMEINNAFGSIIRMNRERMESRIAGILFGEEG
ncbi:MAG: V-type ATP synthase subunit E [Clostridiales bacterium]|nr:V-type ATP synthase subunit E [Clostridiales bacterium]